MVGRWAMDMVTHQPPNMDIRTHIKGHQTPNTEMKTNIKKDVKETQSHKQAF